MGKEELFEKLKNRGLFWSYDKSITYEDIGDRLFVEHLLKYGDFDDLIEVFKLFPKVFIRSVWEERMKEDRRFVRLNVMLARLFFDMDVDGEYFKNIKHARYEKLKLFAS